jgi:hypothetical protein
MRNSLAAISGLQLSGIMSLNARLAPGVRHELAGEHLPKRWIVASPPHFDQALLQPASFKILRGRIALLRAAHEAAPDDEVADALGVAHRVRDRGGGALREPEDREALEARGVDHAGKVAHHGLEGNLGHLAVRQPGAALIEAKQRIVTRQPGHPRHHRGIVPVVLQVSKPVRRANERRPIAADGKCDPGAVEARAKADLLLHLRFRLQSNSAYRKLTSPRRRSSISTAASSSIRATTRKSRAGQARRR